MLSNGTKAVTGYASPTDEDRKFNPYVILQQLEYSQGLGMNRCAQSLAGNVLVVPGAIGIYDATLLRKILHEKSIRSVTEDLEIALEMHKREGRIGYVSLAKSSTVVPSSFDALWNQRLRWFAGWFHNTLSVHRDLLRKKCWLSLLLWYCYIFDYGGAFIDLMALCAFPFLFWFAPDRVFFVAGILVFVPYGLIVGVIYQALALKYAYGKHNYKTLLLYTWFYPIVRLINVLARIVSSFKYLKGDNGSWQKT
jgi:biofilm PGA synthesis N-glycosyltransferase PgaC